MPTRTAEAEWQGSLSKGGGTMKFGSGAFEGRYSFGSRFGDENGTNPEELIAAAGCFSMALAYGLEGAGYTPKRIRTTVKTHIERSGDGFRITRIELDTSAEIPGINEARFRSQAEAAKWDCPVSRALAGTEIALTARLAAH